MKRFSGMLLVCLMLCAAALGEATVSAVPTPAAGETLPDRATENDAPVVTALGAGVVTLSPDVAVFTFTLSSTALTAAEAQNASAASAEKLYAALESAGVRREDIYAVNYNADTVYSYQYGKLGEGENPSGFSVKNDVVVRLKDMRALGAVIDSAMQNGVDSSYGMSFESSQAQAAYDRALQLATADAVRKAGLLAEASGLTLGRILSIGEKEAGTSSAGERENLSPASAADSLQYEIQITAYAEVCFEAE